MSRVECRRSSWDCGDSGVLLFALAGDSAPVVCLCSPSIFYAGVIGVFFAYCLCGPEVASIHTCRCLSIGHSE